MGRYSGWFSNLGRAAVVLLTLEIATVTVLRYFLHAADAPGPVLANAYADPFLIVHVVSGLLAFVIAPLQFVSAIRLRAPRVHRLSGRIYVAACLVAGPAGFVLALGTTAGPIAAAGFAIPALLLPIFTWLGWRAAVERRFGAHGDWMLRSYAVISTAITLRLMLPAAGLLGLPFLPAYQAIAWLSWSTNLVLFEAWIRRKRRNQISPASGLEGSAYLRVPMRPAR